jgi:RNA polymerase sigma-70 factor (ECF subfamily)
VESGARERIGMRVLELDAADLGEVENLANCLPHETPALDLLERLPEPQREAIRARMLDELDYPEVARDLHCSEAVVRQRVSRGLRELRAQLGESGADQ